MKNLLYLFTFLSILSGCKKDKDEEVEISPEIKVEIQKFGYVIVAYKDTSVAKFRLDFGDGISTENSFMSLDVAIVSNHTYETSGRYTISLTIWDKQNRRKVIATRITISDIPSKPTAGFTVQLLENGTVKINNQSKNATTYEWSGTGGQLYYFPSRVENPVFVYETNGRYRLSLRARNEANRVDTTSVIFEVKNAKEILPFQFKGLFLGKEWNIDGSDINTFDFTWGFAGISGYSCNSFSAPNFGNIFIINDTNLQNLDIQERYEKLEGQLKVGKISTKKWDVRISKNSSVWDRYSSESYLLQRDPDAQLEILEIQEVDQPKLIPEMYHKSFWVTFKIKADFGNNINIDGTLKVRYLIYKVTE